MVEAHPAYRNRLQLHQTLFATLAFHEKVFYDKLAGKSLLLLSNKIGQNQTGTRPPNLSLVKATKRVSETESKTSQITTTLQWGVMTLKMLNLWFKAKSHKSAANSQSQTMTSIRDKRLLRKSGLNSAIFLLRPLCKASPRQTTN